MESPEFLKILEIVDYMACLASTLKFPPDVWMVRFFPEQQLTSDRLSYSPQILA